MNLSASIETRVGSRGSWWPWLLILVLVHRQAVGETPKAGEGGWPRQCAQAWTMPPVYLLW